MLDDGTIFLQIMYTLVLYPIPTLTNYGFFSNCLLFQFILNFTPVYFKP